MKTSPKDKEENRMNTNEKNWHIPWGVIHNKHDYSKILIVEDDKELGKVCNVKLDPEQAILLAHALITPPGEVHLQG